jgi:hypothetical protein
MKKYTANLDRESISLDIGFKIVVVKNGTEYMESELTARFPKYFKEIVEEKATKIEVKPETKVEAPKEELLLDNSSAVEVTIEAPVVEEVKPSRKGK